MNEKGTFSVAFVLFDMKMHSNLTSKNSRDQGHLVTLAKGHLSVACQHFQRTQGKGVKKIYIFGPGHMTKMAASHIYGKTLKNLLLQNHCADCLETVYVPSGELAL